MLGIAFVSCKKKDNYFDIVEKFVGARIVIPDSSIFQIIDTPIPLDLDDFDYKVITYVDSSDCTACNMKLYQWKCIISELQSINKDLNIGFLMILDSSNKKDFYRVLSEEKFPLPISFDTNHQFLRLNQIPQKKMFDQFHTFLVDSDNVVLAIGNPVVNPKIKSLFKKIINKECAQFNYNNIYKEHADTSLMFGAINVSDTARISLDLSNTDTCSLHIQDIVTSCHCMSVHSTANLITPNGNVKLNISVHPEEKNTNYHETISVFYEEKDTPVTIVVNGFVN